MTALPLLDMATSVQHPDREVSPRRPPIIAIVGIDGSGKTTQAHRLATALTGHGLPAAYWQNAGGRRWFGRLARRLGRRDARRLLGRGGLLLVESVLRWLAIARALLRTAIAGRVAVMDRYAVCQYTSIRVQGGHRWERLARVCYRVFPPPDVTFLLDVDPVEAYRRIEGRATDHESLDFLAASAATYRSLPESVSFVVIDGNGTPDQVTRAIIDHLPEPVAAWPHPADRQRLASPSA
jgi:dTMP kinase